jgi:hypothetical protein
MILTVPQHNNTNTHTTQPEPEEEAKVSAKVLNERGDTELTRLTVEIPTDLWVRSKLVIAKSTERLTMRVLMSEGLEIRVSQIEKGLEKAGVA